MKNIHHTQYAERSEEIIAQAQQATATSKYIVVFSRCTRTSVCG